MVKRLFCKSCGQDVTPGGQKHNCPGMSRRNPAPEASEPRSPSETVTASVGTAISTLARAATPEGGMIKLELWPEGYVLWYHGQIAWKSWEHTGKTVTAAIVASVDSEAVRKALIDVAAGAQPAAWGMFSSSAGCLSVTTDEAVAKRWAAESVDGISVGPLYRHPPAIPAPQAVPAEDIAGLAERLCHAVEGECDGLAIDHNQAVAILDYVGVVALQAERDDLDRRLNEEQMQTVNGGEIITDLKAERDNALEELGRVIMACPPGMRTSPASDGVKQLRAAYESAQPQPDWTPTHQHLKRRSLYRFVGKATLQTSLPLRDMDEMVVYQAEDGSFWVRPDVEFYDGRFLTLAGGGAE